jgi:hypothetical protein
MAKEYQFSWRSAVPEALLKGAYFDRYEEVGDCLYLHSSVLLQI